MLFLLNISLVHLWSDAAILDIIQDPGGGTLARTSESEQIEMVNEKVVLKPLGYISYDGTSKPFRYKQGAVFEVSCSYTFKNMSSRSASVLMGFSVEEFKWEFEGRDGSDDQSGTETNYNSDFQAQAGGKQLKVEWMRGSDYYGYYTFTVNFAPYQELVVINTYKYRMNRIYGHRGDLCMGYILETGATWAGAIRQCRVIIYELEHVTYYSYHDFKPDEHSNIQRYYSSESYHIPHIFASSSLKSDAYGTYNPFCARDDRPETAWVEGASGYGIGEWIALVPPIANDNSADIKYSIIAGIRRPRTCTIKIPD
jgi:hypothetical protein